MEINFLMKSQKRYFASGVTKVVDFRLAALRKLRRVLLRNKHKILKALTADLGKSPAEGFMTELGLVLEELTFAEKHLQKWSKPKARRISLAQFPGEAYSIREPYGVVLIMSPWNYPFMLTMAPLVGAIAAGNCCILKPAKDSHATSRVIRELIEEAFPVGYVAVVEGGREENQALLDQPFDYIFFTGGEHVGRIVMEKAAVNLTPVTLELGGKSPCIVDESADIDIAAKRIVFGKFLNSGQTCAAPDYVLVHRSVKDKLIDGMKRWLVTFYGENPLNSLDYSHIITEKHYERLMTLMKTATITYGGHGNKETRQIMPTILTEVSLDSPVMTEEIFGPILPVLAYESLDEVEEIIQSRRKPLALYLFTNNIRTERRILRNLSFGGGCINDTVIHMATTHMGFGGVGGSGMGSYHGHQSYQTFTHEKNILKKGTKWDVPLRYPPYKKWKEILMNWVLR